MMMLLIAGSCFSFFFSSSHKQHQRQAACARTQATEQDRTSFEFVLTDHRMGNLRSQPSSSSQDTVSTDASHEDTTTERPTTVATGAAPLTQRRLTIERRSTIPLELEDPDDCTIGEAESDLFWSDDQQRNQPMAHDDTDDDHDDDSFNGRLIRLPKEARNILAGGIAGIVAKSVVAPLDRIKILYQVSAAKFHLLDIPRVARNIVRDEGLSALWKGNTATMIRVFPYSGIQFMVFDRCKQYFLLRDEEADHWTRFGDGSTTAETRTTEGNRADRKWGLTPIESLVSGMIAGTVSVICTYPLDLTRAQLAVLKKKKDHTHGFANVLRDNYRRSGVAGLFRGISPTLLGILPYSGIAFALNEQGKREIQHLSGREVTTVERMQCGALSGLVAQTVTYPIEVTRRRMQTIGLVGTQGDTALTSLGCSSKRPIVSALPTMASTISSLYAEQGMRGFLKGVTMNWMKGPVAFSISFTTFDLVQKRMENSQERSQRLSSISHSTSR